MKKLKYLLLLCMFYNTQMFSQDIWKPSVINGFGSNANFDINKLVVFNNQLYAATGNDSGKIYTSSTAHPGSWNACYYAPNSTNITFLTTTNQGGGYLYASAKGTANANNKVYRSQDGINWSPYFSLNSTNIPLVFPFNANGNQDTMYVAVSEFPNAKIYKSYYNSNDPNNTSTQWTNPLTISDTSGAIVFTSHTIHNGKVYLGTNSFYHYMYSSSDGIHWIEDSLFQPNRNNLGITALGSFGGYAYIGTRNNINGSQIFRSNNDTTWTLIATLQGYNATTAFYSTGTELWLAAQNVSGAGLIMRSTDGIAFSVSQDTGFGNDNNSGANANFELFNNNLYYATSNHNATSSVGPLVTDGAQIWRFCLNGTPPPFSLGNDVAVCQNSPVTLNAGSGFANYYWSNHSQSQSINPSSYDDYFVTVSAANGCTSTDTVTVEFFDLPSVPTISIADTSIVCSGSSISITASDSFYESNAAAFNGNGDYIKGNDYTNLMNITDESLTIEFWFNASNAGALVNEASNNASTWFNNVLKLNANGDLILAVQNVPAVTIGNVAFNTWNHIAIRYNKTNLKLDAVLNGLASTNFSIGDRAAPWEQEVAIAQSFNFGQASSQAYLQQNWFAGRMKDIRIWNYARSENQIQLAMNTMVMPNELGLVANYLLNDGTGKIAADQSINNLSATLINHARFVSAPIFAWSPITFLSSNTGSTVIATPTTTTDYTITATNATGCSITKAITLLVPTAGISSSATSVCEYAPVYYANTGSLPDSTKWYVDGAMVSANFNLFTHNPTATGNQTIRLISYTSTCIDSATTSLVVFENPTSSATSPQTVCTFDDVVLFDTVAGGTLPYTFLWTDGANTYPTQNIVVNASNDFNFSCTVTDGNGCSSISNTAIFATPLTDIYGTVTYSGGLVTSGNAVLYNYQANYARFDTLQVSPLDNTTGMYQFTFLLPHQFIIKVFPDQTLFPTLSPTYASNSFLWDVGTTVVNHNCVNNDTINVTMAEVITQTGPGNIRGRILEGAGFRNIGEPITGVDVKLGRNPGGGIAMSTNTSNTNAADGGGYYYFNNIGIGNYTVYVDIPGLYRDSSYTFDITNTNNQFIYFDYIADSTTIYINYTVGIGTVSKELNSFLIYPNPFKDNATIEFSVASNQKINIELYDIVGNAIGATTLNATTGIQRIKVSDMTNDLKAGIYFVKLQMDNKFYKQKIVVLD